MDNQSMGSHNEPFFDLLQPPSITPASGSSSSNYVQNGPRRMDSSSYSFNNDDVLPNYDFQPLRSNGSGSGARIEEAGSKYRQASPSFEPQVRDPPVTYEKYESTRSRHEFDKDAYDSATAAAVERTMKKYADNLLRVLEGMGGRLSQLEATTQRLEVAFEKSKVANANNHGETDGRLRMLENMVREVQRGVQVLRDKQEINEAQFQLKLQREKADTPSNKTESQAPPIASAPQQPVIPQPPPPSPQPQPVDSNVQQPLPPVPILQQPSPVPIVVSQSPHPPQQVPHSIPQQSQQPTYTYPSQNPVPAPPPPPPAMQQHPQAPPAYVHQPEAPPYPPVPVSHPQGPPHHPSQSQAPPLPGPPVNYSLDMPSYLPPPPPPYGAPPPPPQRHHQQQQQQHGPPPPQMYDGLPGRTSSGPLALPPPPSAYQQQYENYGGGSGSYGRVASSGGYPHLPTAQPIQQSLPSGRPPSRSGVDDVIDKVAAMGFPRDQVRATVQRLTENGQAVDMNVVLDKLMNGGGGDGGPPKAGWFGR